MNRNEKGSMLMETVIVMPLLVALIFGALQMAHIHVARQIVSYAAYAASSRPTATGWASTRVLISWTSASASASTA